MRVSHRQLIILNTPVRKSGGVSLCAEFVSSILYMIIMEEIHIKSNKDIICLPINNSQHPII
ncbi:hypothetical protein EJ483_00210 [Acinetobacter pittii]|nr:hypothetical protein EJ483_00210 [Acinetobacter pittii]RZG99696.1 hypothetical protein EXE01_13515 [Acinetobacter pittii]RZH16757.1 hypothetical protein EXD95_16715 [Acinetobacter pittii]RZH41831.1 hypothetical protein EXD94_09915 [Acinetobacter pittii]